MDFSEERYVRVYTRKTPEWMALCWQAKALHALLLMECDRAGIIPVPMGARRVRMIAAAMGMPEDVTAVGLADLLDDGRVVETDVGYVWPNFIPAQETAKSDKFRAKEYRARKRTERAELALSGRTVTKRDARDTERDETVHPYRAVPSSLREVGAAAGAAPLRSSEQLVVVVEKEKEPTRFSKTTTPTTRTRSANFVGTPEQLAFQGEWNRFREERGMFPESLTPALAAGLQELLDHAEAKRPDDTGRVLGLMIRGFHTDPDVNSKRLKTFLNSEVWPARFDTACANASAELERAERASRKRRY